MNRTKITDYFTNYTSNYNLNDSYAYGADAAYIGLKKFSLRVKADNFYDDEYKKVIALK